MSSVPFETVPVEHSIPLVPPALSNVESTAEVTVFELASIANDVYNLDNLPTPMLGINGYTVNADSIVTSAWGVKMCVYQKGNINCLAFKGTSTMQDKVQDIVLALGLFKSWAAIQPTINAALKLISQFSVNMVTGHSLGGYFAEIVATNNGLSGVSFCGPGVNGPIVRLGGDKVSAGFQNIQYEHDLLGNALAGVYTHVKWSVYFIYSEYAHSLEGTGGMIDVFGQHLNIKNTNILDFCSSRPTGYYYPK